MPVTAAQIHSAQEMGGENQFKIDDTEVSQVRWRTCSTRVIVLGSHHSMSPSCHFEQAVLTNNPTVVCCTLSLSQQSLGARVKVH